MLSRITFLFLVCCLISVSAHAEFYQYTDKNGNLRFTDNIGDIPAAQRPGVKRYKELKPDVLPDKNLTPDVTGAHDKQAGQSAKGTVSIDRKAAALSKEKADLDQQFAALRAEKEALSKRPGKDAAPDAVKAYTKKVEELNKRIKVYEQKRAAFGKKVGAFEAMVKASRKK